MNAVHPGIVDTEIIRHMSFFNSWFSSIFLKPIVWPFIKSPKQGAQTTIFCALDPSLEKVTGNYYRFVQQKCILKIYSLIPCSDYKITTISMEAQDEKLAAWLWSVSEKWTRLNV